MAHINVTLLGGETVIVLHKKIAIKVNILKMLPHVSAKGAALCFNCYSTLWL